MKSNMYTNNLIQRLLKPITMFIEPRYFLGSIVGVASGLLGASGAKKAAKAQSDASEAQIAEQRRQFDITQKQFAPYRESGERGLAEYEARIGDYGAAEGLITSDQPLPFQFGAEEFGQYKDPGYDFRLAEGERALNRGFAGMGKRMSGERAAGLISYGQQMGSQEFGAARGRAFQDYSTQVTREQEAYQRSLGSYGRQYQDPLNRYADLAAIGQSSVAQTAASRQAATDSITRSIGAAGEAKAAGVLGQYGAISKTIGDLGNYFGGPTGGGANWGGSGVSGPSGTIDTGGGFLANLPSGGYY